MYNLPIVKLPTYLVLINILNNLSFVSTGISIVQSFAEKLDFFVFSFMNWPYTMLYLLSKYDAFVFGSKKKLYQKRAVKIKASSI